jgi:DNA polymerase-4
MFKALKACPQATVIRPDFAKYQTESRRIMDLLGGLTPLVQPLSLDEAWLDLTGTERLNRGPPALALARIQSRIEAETGLTVSVGLAANKFLAKIASERDKPRGFCVLGAQEARAFLAPRPAGVLPGVGPVFAKELERAGFATVGALAAADPRALAERFGAAGLRLSRLAQGLDVREVDPDQTRKSLSAETTFERDLSALSDLEDALWPLCEKVARRARADGVAGRVAVLKLKGADFHAVSRRRTLPAPTMAARTLFLEARTLLAEEARSGRAFRLVGAGLTGLAPSGEVAADLFPDEDGRAARTETTADALRARFGPTAVISGRTFNTLVRQSRAGPPDGGRGEE